MVEVISTVLAAATATPPAGPYDLATLVDLRDELSIKSIDTSNDATLSRYITQASTAICSYCGRVFAVEALQDAFYIQQDPYPYQMPGGVNPLQLSRWPLAATGVVNFTGNTHGSTLVDGIASTAGLVDGMLVFAADGSIPPGAEIVSIVPNVSITLSLAATSSETALSLSTGVQVIQTLAVGDLQTLVYGQDFTIDAERGWLIRLNNFTGVAQKWEAEPVTVQYQAGFTAVPFDLADACQRLVVGRFRARGRDPVLMEQTQVGPGTQRWWIGSLPSQEGAF